jgi:type IV pilus assembly protein PilX
MNLVSPRTHSVDRGMALISALLLLMVITMLGIAMFRSFGLQERIAGNTREKGRALHAADSAQGYAQFWLTANGGANATTGIVCAAGLVDADAGNGQVCSNILSSVVPNVANVPWMVGAGESAVTYTPPGLAVGGTDNPYWKTPRFYISALSHVYEPQAHTDVYAYQIDSTGYGGSREAIAVVETGYTVKVTRSTQALGGTGSHAAVQSVADLGGP